MFFTQDDYKKIQQWLIKNSVKDTEFNEANIPFNGEETITIVQGNQNKKVFLKDLIAQVFNLGISDFVNITDKYDTPNISLEEAIRLIPSRARKEGQVITFLDREDHWHIYQFKGVLNQWNVLDTWEDLFDWEKLIIDSILPDEEDLTKSLPDENGNSYLSLKDREYNPEDFSGLGRIILRKNIVEIEDPIYGKVKKNILYQDMFTQSNTIYEIRYDFDLNGSEITIPESCVLDFQGGSLSNGTIVGNETGIAVNSDSLVLFREGLVIEGSWDVKTINVGWYDLQNIEYPLIGVQQILKMQSDDQYNTIVFPSYELYLTPLAAREKMMNILSNTKVIVPSAIHICTNSFDGASLFYIRNKKNIEIEGVKLVGDMDTHIIPEGANTHEWQFGIVVNGSENITIKNFTCTKFMGDGVYLGNYGLNKNIKLYNITSDYNRRQGLSVEKIDGLTIERCSFTNTGKQLYTAPGAGIDFEPWIVDDENEPIVLKNILIKECYFRGNTGNDILVYNPNGLIENFIVDNCVLDDYSLNSSGVMQAGAKTGSEFTGIIKNVIYKNCKFSYYAMKHTLPENIEDGSDNITLDSCEIGSCVWYYNSTKTEKIIIKNSTIQPKYVPFPVTEGIHPLLYVGGKSSNVSFVNCIFKNRNNLCTQLMNTPSTSFYPSGLTFDNCSFYGDGFEIKDFELGIADKITNCYFKSISCNARIIRDKDIFVERNIFEQGDETQRFTLSDVLHKSNTPELSDGYYKMIIDHNIFKGNAGFIYSYYQGGRSDIALYFRNNFYEGTPIVKGSRQYGIFESTKVNPLNMATSQGPTENRPTDDLYVGKRYYDNTIRRIIYWDGGKWIDERGKIPYKSTGPTEDRPVGENDSRYQGQMYYDTTLLKMIYWDGTRWVDERGNIPYKIKGSTEERPAAANYDVYKGMTYYDTTINKPIWWTGTKWIDATGANV